MQKLQKAENIKTGSLSKPKIERNLEFYLK